MNKDQIKTKIVLYLIAGWIIFIAGFVVYYVVHDVQDKASLEFLQDIYQQNFPKEKNKIVYKSIVPLDYYQALGREMDEACQGNIGTNTLQEQARNIVNNRPGIPLEQDLDPNSLLVLDLTDYEAQKRIKLFNKKLLAADPQQVKTIAFTWQDICAPHTSDRYLSASGIDIGPLPQSAGAAVFNALVIDVVSSKIIGQESWYRGFGEKTSSDRLEKDLWERFDGWILKEKTSFIGVFIMLIATIGLIVLAADSKNKG